MTQTTFTVGRDVLRAYVNKIPRDDAIAFVPWQEFIKAVIIWEDVSTDRLAGSIDHGAFAGLTDDDHTQYVDAAGSRTWTRPLTTTDGQYRGVIVSGTLGENCTYGDLLYLKSDGKWWQTDADAAATAAGVLVGLCCNTTTADSTLNVLVQGTFCETDWSWTVGAPIYISTSKGDMTTTAPSATSDIVRVVGYAYHADGIVFNPDNAWVEIV